MRLPCLRGGPSAFFQPSQGDEIDCRFPAEAEPGSRRLALPEGPVGQLQWTPAGLPQPPDAGGRDAGLFSLAPCWAYSVASLSVATGCWSTSSASTSRSPIPFRSSSSARSSSDLPWSRHGLQGGLGGGGGVLRRLRQCFPGRARGGSQSDRQHAHPGCLAPAGDHGRRHSLGAQLDHRQLSSAALFGRLALTLRPAEGD